MPLIECRALAADAYPAGLRLACDLWTAAQQTVDCPLSFSAIEEFWDGVKMIGALERRSFWIEINYATEEIVLLDVTAPRRRFGGRKRHDELLEAAAAAVQALLEGMESRQPVQRREITVPQPHGPPG